MNLTIGPLTQADLGPADRVFRIAFGTRNGLPDPLQFDGDAARIRTRCSSGHVVALGAWDDGTLVASSLGTAWGEFGWLGPLSVVPGLWDQGIGQQLIDSTIGGLERRGCRHLALFTFGESPKHLALYRKFGFWPYFPTAVMEKKIARREITSEPTAYSRTSAEEDAAYLDSCRALTSLIYAGLDVSREMLAVRRQSLGDTLFVLEDDRIVGFAVCQCGAGTEAGTGTTYVKFAASRPGPLASQTLQKLLSACEEMAAVNGTTRLVAGVNTARRGAYSTMVDSGFKTIQQGIAMHRPDEPAYDRPDAYVIDDWR